MKKATGIYPVADVETMAPIEGPRKIVCVGLNYKDHAEEGHNPIPDESVLFSKFSTSIIGPEDVIRWDPDLTKKVDYEAELVVVVGREARNVGRDNAHDYIAGYTIGNDVSARDLQHNDDHWVRGKSLDTFSPIGPTLVTPDEIDEPHDLEIWAEVNGKRLQDSTTSNLIFGVDELIGFCSRSFTLKTGDLLFTGTPSGVGVYRDPPVLLEEDDTVTIGIEELGEITTKYIYS